VVGDLALWLERLPRKRKALGLVPGSEKKKEPKKKKKSKLRPETMVVVSVLIKKLA